MTNGLVDGNAPSSQEESSLGRWPTLAAMLAERVRMHPERIAIRFVADDGAEVALTYRELLQRSTEVAAELSENAEPGDRVALLFPAGLEFLVGFFACGLAGLIPAPTCFPRLGRSMPRLDAVVESCRPSVLLTDSVTSGGIDPGLLSSKVAGLRRVLTDAKNGKHSDATFQTQAVSPDDIALLQYTSGSTSAAKGVMVLHRNLLSNLEAIRRGFAISWQDEDAVESDLETGVFWLPAYHDMGLIGGILAPLYVGGSTVLLSPQSFLSRPARWLETISRYRATISGAPNFAYQLCVDRYAKRLPADLNLSTWKLAFCGAEPISAETMRSFASTFQEVGFSDSAFYPCYGLAEATLLAAGPDGPRPLSITAVDRKSLSEGRLVPTENADSGQTSELVGCGTAAYGTKLAIVDPKTERRVADGSVGEIWLSGAAVTAGYFQNPEATETTFAAKLSGCDKPNCAEFVDQDQRWMRTGDLGVQLDGQLYVTGRLKDVIIVRGRNLYPQDIEHSVVSVFADGSTKVAAFSVPGPYGEELAVVAETPRSINAEQLSEITRKIRLAIVGEHEIDVRHVLLVRPVSIPVTTSGKVQRSLSRDMMLDDSFKCRHRWDRTALKIEGELPPKPNIDPEDLSESLEAASAEIQRWLLQWLIQRIGVPTEEATPDRPFAEFGLDSLATLELIGELRDWLELDLELVLAWNYPTVSKLAPHLAMQLAGIDDQSDEETPLDLENSADLQSLLLEVENLTDDEIYNALASQREL